MIIPHVNNKQLGPLKIPPKSHSQAGVKNLATNSQNWAWRFSFTEVQNRPISGDILPYPGCLRAHYRARAPLERISDKYGIWIPSISTSEAVSQPRVSSTPIAACVLLLRTTLLGAALVDSCSMPPHQHEKKRKTRVKKVSTAEYHSIQLRFFAKTQEHVACLDVLPMTSWLYRYIVCSPIQRVRELWRADWLWVSWLAQFVQYFTARTKESQRFVIFHCQK